MPSKIFYLTEVAYI